MTDDLVRDVLEQNQAKLRNWFFAEGKKAALDGKRAQDCKYEKGLFRLWWMDGYNNGKDWM